MESSEINSQAAAWVARLDREGDSEVVRAELEAWLAADRRHRGAFLRAEAAWALLNRASVLRDAEAAAPSRPSRRTIMAGAAAAAMAAGVAGVVLSQPPRRTYQTGLGELRRVRLEDGSVMALNSQTRLEVVMGRSFRRLRLLEGEAWFQVAKDASRPFTVEGDGSQVRAIGTAFSVRRRAAGTDVIVTEGVIELRSGDASAQPVKLPAGSRASVGASGDIRSARSSAAEIDRSLAWREGQIALAGETLGEAVEAFNRYNVRKLVIAAPELAGARLVGWFWLDDPDAFARAAARTLKAQVRVEGARIILAAGA